MNLRGRIRLEDTAQQGDGAFTPWGVVARQIAGSPADPCRAVPGGFSAVALGGPCLTSSRSRDSAANSAAGASVPAASFGAAAR